MSRIVKDYVGMIVIGLLFLAGFGAGAIFIERETEPGSITPIETTPFVTGEPDLLVDAAWLAGNLDSIDLIIDLSDRDVYEKEHIPGAVHVWHEDTMPLFAAHYGESGFLTDPASDSLVLPYPLETRIVVYDNNKSERASHFLWLLQASGFRNTWVLDGGVAAWKGADLPVSSERSHLPPAQQIEPAWIDTYKIGLDELFARLEDPALTIIDSRTPEEQQDTVNQTLRIGKIPGSWSIPATEVLGEDGTFRSPEDLRELFSPLGIEPGAEIVVYGRFGNETGQMWLALRRAGFENVRVYDSGWVSWGGNVYVPVEPLGSTPQAAPPIATPDASPVASPMATPLATPVATPLGTPAATPR